MPRAASQPSRALRVNSASSGIRWIPDRRFSGMIAAFVWVLIGFMIVPADFNYTDFNAEGSTSGPFVLFPLITVGNLVLIWRRSLALLVLRRMNTLFLAFLFLAAVSIAWSANPEVTLRRLIRLYAIVSISFAFVLVGW